MVRALEDAAAADGIVHAGDGVATRRIGALSRLRVVDAILSGTHEPGSSHYDLLRAFASDATLRRVSSELEACGYLTHEFGDSIFIEKRQHEDRWRVRPKPDATSDGASHDGTPVRLRPDLHRSL